MYREETVSPHFSGRNAKWILMKLGSVGWHKKLRTISVFITINIAEVYFHMEYFAKNTLGISFTLIQIAAFQSCFACTSSDHAVIFGSPHFCVSISQKWTLPTFALINSDRGRIILRWGIVFFPYVFGMLSYFCMFGLLTYFLVFCLYVPFSIWIGTF